MALIPPHGADELRPLIVDDARRGELEAEALTLPSLMISSAAAANAVMMGAGYFTPLSGYMNRANALSVAENMRTSDGLFWPVPVLNLAENCPVEAGQRLEIGLLLADLLRQGGSHQAAVNLYRQLSAEDVTDARPLLALALLQQDRGRTADVQALLKQARERRESNERISPLIDVVARQLELSAARNIASEQSRTKAIQEGSDRP